MSAEVVEVKRRISELVEQIISSKWMLCTLLVIYFTPQEYAIGATFFKIWQLTQMGIFIFALLAFWAGECKPTGRWILLSLFYFSFYIFSSGVSGSLAVLPSNIYECLRGIGFLTVTEICIQKKIKNYLKCFGLAGMIMCSIHMITEYAITTGIMSPYQVGSGDTFRIEWMVYFFLTYDNESVYFVLPTILSLLLYGIRYSSRRYFLYGMTVLILSWAFAFWLNTVTALIAYSLILLLLLFASVVFIIKKRMNVKTYPIILSQRRFAAGIGILFALTAVFVLLVVSGSLGHIAEMLGKDPTFSGRTEIWQKSIDNIYSHVLFGRGREGFEITRQVIGQSHCHNILLELFYTGGVVSFALFFAGVCACVSRRTLYWEDAERTQCYVLVLIFIIAIFISANLDWYPAIQVQFFIFESLCVLNADQKEAPTRAYLHE